LKSGFDRIGLQLIAEWQFWQEIAMGPCGLETWAWGALDACLTPLAGCCERAAASSDKAATTPAMSLRNRCTKISRPWKYHGSGNAECS
jgi:hypothetical protein